MGAWSCKLEDWLGVPLPVDGVLSTSFTFDAPEAVAAEPPAAIFCAEDSRGCHLEVYPRPDDSIYVAGCGGSRLVSAADLRADVLPPSDTNRPDAVRVAAAQRSLAALSSAFKAEDDDDSRPQQTTQPPSVQQQACMRPCAPDGLPIVGPLPSVANVYAATGGNVWGITWAPIVGKVVSEMILDDGDVSVLNPRAFSPRRFDTPTYRTLVNQRGRERSGAGRVGEQW